MVFGCLAQGCGVYRTDEQSAGILVLFAMRRGCIFFPGIAFGVRYGAFSGTAADIPGMQTGINDVSDVADRK